MTDKLTESIGPIIKDMSVQMSALGRGGEPTEPAALVAFLLSDEASFVSYTERLILLRQDFVAES